MLCTNCRTATFVRITGLSFNGDQVLQAFMVKDFHHAGEGTLVQGCLDGLDRKEGLLPGFGWHSGPLHARSGPED